MGDLRAPDGCKDTYATGQKRPRTCEHGYYFETEKAWEAAVRPRPPLKRVSEKRAASGKPSLKKGKGFAVTPAQREKVSGLPCVGCGDACEWAEGEHSNDPAHLYPRDLCPCDHAESVIPLCRTCHRIYDNASTRSQLDLLPKITDRGHLDAFAHYITEHGFSPVTLLEHVTGQALVWESSPERERAA